MKYILTLIYLVCTTGGLTFMKLGGDSLKIGSKDGILLSMNWQTFFGFVLYLISFLLWQKLIIKYDLSVMVPIITGIVQIIVLIIGHFIFKETLSTVSIVGVLLIIFGIVLMTIGK
jgi:multidrug transporter EmrE-like cation transporter